MNLLQYLGIVKRREIGENLPTIPVNARHVEYSAIVSLDDEVSKPSDRLIDLALQAAELARSVSMEDVVKRMKLPPYYPDVWPGEHYKLLAGLVLKCKPKVVVEIGTATGLSALAMWKFLPVKSRLVTFDIIPWEQFPDTCLRTEDFADGTLSQVVGDISDPVVLRQHSELLKLADIIFLDGPKDGMFEAVMLDRLADLGLPQGPLVVLDDIRVWNMLAIWRGIAIPKLDVTSFGHWSGTGLIDWRDTPRSETR